MEKGCEGHEEILLVGLGVDIFGHELIFSFTLFMRWCEFVQGMTQSKKQVVRFGNGEGHAGSD